MNARARLTPEEFLTWDVAQEEKHELVSGRVRLMVDATRAHQIIRLNAAVALRRLLRGQPCVSPSTSRRSSHRAATGATRTSPSIAAQAP